jgi:ammonia channel protein AmtB
VSILGPALLPPVQGEIRAIAGRAASYVPPYMFVAFDQWFASTQIYFLRVQLLVVSLFSVLLVFEFIIFILSYIVAFSIRFALRVWKRNVGKNNNKSSGRKTEKED